MKEFSSAKTGAAARVLLVDDNRDGLAARRAVLEEQGLVVTTATNGEEAFEAFSKYKFDLLVTDFKMPKMNGVELIRTVRPLDPQLRVILLSGFVNALGLDEESTGADVVIAKDAREIPQLLRSVSRLLVQKTPRRPPGSQKASRFRTKGQSG
jgi:CheY-like chemotaxis protein